MNKCDLIKRLFEIGAIQFGEFTLKSGQTSSIYINLRKIISYPTLLRDIANIIWQHIQHCQCELICGVPYTALPIATCIAVDQHIPMIMRRKEKKDYGTKQMIEGEFKAQQTCIIVEDIITTGSSIMETAHDLEAAGLKIHDAIALIDREQGGKQKLAIKYNAHAVLTLSEIFSYLLNSPLLNHGERQIIEKLTIEKTIA